MNNAPNLLTSVYIQGLEVLEASSLSVKTPLYTQKLWLGWKVKQVGL